VRVGLEEQPSPAIVRAVAAGQVANANQAVAAALVAAVPVVLLLIAFQRQIIRGLTAGAVK